MITDNAPTKGADHSLFNRDALAHVMEDAGATLLVEMYLLFIDQARELIAQIDTHIGRKDYRQLRKVAHMFKSSAHTVGANEVAALLVELESVAVGSVESVVIQYAVMLHQGFNDVERAIRTEIVRLQSTVEQVEQSGDRQSTSKK